MAEKEKKMTMEELEKEIDIKEKGIAKGRAIFQACKKRLAAIKPQIEAFDVTDIETDPEKLIDFMVLSETTKALLEYQKTTYDELLKQTEELNALYAELYRDCN